MNQKLDWNDICITPDVISYIEHRSDVSIYMLNGNLPLFTAPMDTVVDLNNADIFNKNSINVCLPRNVRTNNELYFQSYGLDEIIELFNSDFKLPKKVLIDVANGNMIKLYNISKSIKEKFGDDIELMVGNIANPETYRKYCEIGVDWVRCSVGSGSVCTTAANIGIFYPPASLVIECNEIAKEFINPSKIIADGGFRNYSEIIKALALGASAVMLGGIFNKALESCGDNYIRNTISYQSISISEAEKLYKKRNIIYKKFRGMSTKEVQKAWNKEELKTAEGISKYNQVEYTLDKWIDNFSDYLRSAMSYTNSINLEAFIGYTHYNIMSDESFKRYNK